MHNMHIFNLYKKMTNNNASREMYKIVGRDFVPCEATKLDWQNT